MKKKIQDYTMEKDGPTKNGSDNTGGGHRKKEKENDRTKGKEKGRNKEKEKK